MLLRYQPARGAQHGDTLVHRETDRLALVWPMDSATPQHRPHVVYESLPHTWYTHWIHEPQTVPKNKDFRYTNMHVRTYNMRSSDHRAHGREKLAHTQQQQQHDRGAGGSREAEHVPSRGKTSLAGQPQSRSRSEWRGKKSSVRTACSGTSTSL